MHDLIVIGAGPAGSTSSYIASLLGLKTLIIDFQEFPRFKPCGGGLTVKSLKLLESLDIDIDSIVEKYCKRVYLITYSGVYELVSSEPIITTVSREVFDKHLLQHALDQGVEFMLDKIVSIECRSDEVIVRGLRDIYRAKVLIGADGAFSITAKFLGNHVCMRDCAIAYMSYVEDSHIDYAVLDFTRIKYGYAWIFPKRNSLNIGVGSLRIENYTKVLIDYVSELNLKLRFVRGYPLPIKPRKIIAHKNIMLTGDAAGFVDPTTGEGIFNAMYSGLIAALCSYKALKLNTKPSSLYLELIKPLVRNLRLGMYLALGLYINDIQLLSRYFNYSIFSNTNLTLSIVSGKVSYVNVIKRIMKLRGILKQVKNLVLKMVK